MTSFESKAPVLTGAKGTLYFGTEYPAKALYYVIRDMCECVDGIVKRRRTIYPC
jgi:hypothetical protein